MHEASMNFDLENVKPFLTKLDEQLNLNLPVSDLAMMAKQTTVGTEKSCTLQIEYGGSKTQIEYRVFMDGIEAPDLYFFTPSEALAKSIQGQMIAFADELGM